MIYSLADRLAACSPAHLSPHMNALEMTKVVRQNISTLLCQLAHMVQPYCRGVGSVGRSGAEVVRAPLLGAVTVALRVTPTAQLWASAHVPHRPVSKAADDRG